MASSQKGIRAGRAFVELFADDTKLVRGLRRASRKIKAFGASVQAMGAKMMKIGAAIAAPLAISTKVFAGFDDQMRAVQAVLGATGREFDRLNEKAQLLGRTTSYTAAQVAGAMLELGRAGFAPKQIDKAIASILALARATGTEIPTAANIAAGALRAFGLEADQMGRVADVMTAAANNSAQTLEDLGEAMRYAAPVADAYGLSLEETTKILGALANFSIKGSMAGNTLKNIMLQLAKPDVRKKLTQLGVATTDAAGNMLEVSGVLKNLGNAIRNMPKADRLSLMNDLFGKRAIAGGIKLTAKSFDRLNVAIDNASGTAQRTAKIMDSGIGGVLRRLWSAVEGVAIAIGESLAGTLSDIGDRISKVVGMITTWIKKNQGIIVSVLKITAAMIGAGVAIIALGLTIKVVAFAIGVLATVVSVAVIAFKVMAAAVALLLTPLGMAITSVVALGAVILYATGAGAKALDWLGKKFAVLRDDALAAWKGIGNALAAGDIGLAMKILWLTLKMEWIRGINLLERSWLSFKEFFIKNAINAFGAVLKETNNLVSSMQTLWVLMSTGFKHAWVNATSWFKKQAGAMEWIASDVSARIKKAFDKSFDYEGAMLKASKKLVSNEQRIERDRRKRVNAVEKDRMNRLVNIEKVRAATNEQITKDISAARDKRQQEYTKKIAKSEAELARAREDWKQAISKAQSFGGKTSGADVPGGGAYDPKSILDKMGDVGKALATATNRISVKGTFSAAAVSGLGAGSAADRTATATEQTSARVKKLMDLYKATAMKFTL